MNIEQILENQQLKKRLQQRKEKKIKQKMEKEKRKLVNLDQEHLKNGTIQKTKIIRKKTFVTEVQKKRKAPIQYQQNVSINTFHAETNNYQTILKRTQEKIRFDEKKLQQGCQAIVAYALEQKEKTISVHIKMENQIQCSDRPVVLKMQIPEPESPTIMIVRDLERMEGQGLKEINVKIMEIKEFIEKFKTQKKFKKSIKSESIRILCSFEIFVKSKAIERLIKNKLPIFPIDEKKVPFCLQEKCSSYRQYIHYLLQHCFCLTRSGSQHTLHLHSRNARELSVNIPPLVHQLVSKLIGRSKKKGNLVVGISLKTPTSISIPIYSV